MVGIALFYCVYFIGTACGLSNDKKNLFIAAASLAMYAAWNRHAAIGLVVLALVAYAFNQINVKQQVAPVAIVAALAALVAAKYWSGVPQFLGMPADYKQPFYVIGISFYIFTVIGYIVDVAYREAAPLKRFRELFVLVSFWPHLAAGPILRLEHIRAGLSVKRPITDSILRLAVTLILVGLAKKFFIADGVGVYVDANLGIGGTGIAEMNGFQALVTLLGFGTQIYFDFSGYSDIAIGCAYLIGFRLPANFNYPYASTSLTEFWRRWHISLSTWFRDYVFVPLGGNRHGNLYLNLLLVFGLSGIWHGTGLSFLVWGLIHGGFICLEKFAGQWFLRIPIVIRRAYVISVAMGAWAFFRLDHAYAVAWLKKILNLTSYNFSLDSPYYVAPVIYFIVMLAIDHLIKYYHVGNDGFIREEKQRWRNSYALGCFSLFLFFHGKALPFIYFKF
jgi:alginate O-acetyltransferase complex protein AlgI